MPIRSVTVIQIWKKQGSFVFVAGKDLVLLIGIKMDGEVDSAKLLPILRNHGVIFKKH